MRLATHSGVNVDDVMRYFLPSCSDGRCNRSSNWLGHGANIGSSWPRHPSAIGRLMVVRSASPSDRCASLRARLRRQEPVIHVTHRLVLSPTATVELINSLTSTLTALKETRKQLQEATPQ